MKRYAIVMSAMALVGTTALAQADETLKFRVVAHAVSAQSQEVGDVDGHLLTLVRFSGLASMPDGSVGQVGFVGQTDYIKGAGTFNVYNNLTLSDGSVLWFKTEGGKATMEGTTTKFSGPIVILGGKGRFEGAKGDGIATGARPTPAGSKFRRRDSSAMCSQIEGTHGGPSDAGRSEETDGVRYRRPDRPQLGQTLF